MTTQAREFIDFWIENSVHAAEQLRTPGASQVVADLAARCIGAAKDQGIPDVDLSAEIGDVSEYIRGKLKAANIAENDRHRPTT